MSAATIPAFLYERCRQSPDAIAHYELEKNGKWRPTTWENYFSQVASAAGGLLARGLAAGQKIGIMAPASCHWDTMQMAILFCGGVVVGLDPHDSAENLNYIASHTGLQGLVVGEPSLLRKIDDSLRSKLQFVVVIDGETPAGSGTEKVYRLKEFLHHDRLDIASHFNTVSETTPATIIFTSGTTGTPKGIQYTHGQLVVACRSIIEAFPGIDSKTRLACWLPLSNLYQRIINYCAIVVGATTYYVEDPRRVLQYLPEISPHILLGVPRFFEKLHDGILGNIGNKSMLMQNFAFWALETGKKYRKQLRRGNSPGIVARTAFRLADKTVLQRIKSILGINLQYMISGSAPISSWLLEQFHGMGLLVLEAYGISENIVPIAANRPDSFKFGTVGKLLPNNEVKFTDEGELLVKGPGVFSGYYNDKETIGPLNGDGFLATGDYAAFDDEGFLVLTGRKSEIFKTSTGRRVSPVKIEALFGRLPYVEHAVVFGAGKPFLVVLLFVDRQRMTKRMKPEKPAVDIEEDAIPQQWYKFIQNDILKEVAGLQSYLQPAGLLMTFKPLTIEGGELTANLKIRRQEVLKKYGQQIEALYEDINRHRHAGGHTAGTLVVHFS